MSEGFYIPKQDVVEERNGVQFQVAVKGVPIPLPRARELGLVKDQQQVKPQETKEDSLSASADKQTANDEESAPASKRTRKD